MASFGDRLKKEREQRGITLDEIALTTKIGTRLLRALEEEKFEQLPGGIFNKGFVRAYARHVGIDEDQAIADYMTAVGVREPSVTADSQGVSTAPERSAEPVTGPRIHVVHESQPHEAAAEVPWGLLALALLLIALAFASWSYYHREQRVNQNQNSSQVEAANAAGVNAQTADASRTPHSIAPVQASGSQFSSAARTVQQAAVLTPLSVGTPGTFAVLLKASGELDECWVSISVDGNPPYEATLVAPTRKLILAKNEVVVKAGNVGALDFFFNGKKLPEQGEYGKVKTLTFHPDGLQPPPAKSSQATQ